MSFKSSDSIRSATAVTTRLVVISGFRHRHGESFTASCGGTVLFLDPFVYFASQDGCIFGKGKSELNRFATDIDDGYLDIIVDDDGFADFPR